MAEEIQDPINAFPEYVQRILYHYSEAKGYPLEYFIQAFLAAASTSMGRSVTLNTGNYTTIASIWCIILGKRGYVKSEALEDAFKPIVKYQFRLIDKYKSELDEFEEYKRTHPKTKNKPPQEPIKFLANDSTPEKLIMMLASNPKGMGMIYDEIAGFVSRFDRYKSGGDEQMFLTLFNGSSVLRDRMNGASAFAKHTYLSIIGTTQPSVLKDIFQSKTQNGFFDRWLITQPVGFQKQYPNQFGVNPVESDKYNAILYQLLAIEFHEDNAFQMRYTPESWKIINDFQCCMIDEENTTDNDEYRGILAKMEIYLHKFALILQAIQFAIGESIEFVSEEAANGAIILTKYFIDQSIKVRVLNPVEMLKDKWIDVYKSLPEHGIKFDRRHFVKTAKSFGFSDRAADNFLKEHGLRNEQALFYKIQHGQYTKNLF